MSFRTLGKRTSLPRLFSSFANHLHTAKRGQIRGVVRFGLAFAAIMPLAAVWYEPTYIVYAVLGLIVIWLITCMRQWPGWQLVGSFVTAAVTLAIFWGSVFVVWLFLENNLYRVVMLVMLATLNWWYIGEWQRIRVNLFAGEAGAGASPTLALGFLSSFFLTASAESFLVYLSSPMWGLLLGFFIPIVLILGCFIYSSGWSLVRHGSYLMVGGIILLQMFILGLWLPASSYVIGFTVAITFAVVALVLRQEAQGFINKRSLLRELTVAMAALIIVLVGGRWLS